MKTVIFLKDGDIVKIIKDPEKNIDAAINSILSLDFPMIQGTVLFTAVIFIIINMLVDIVYAFLDPKVKLS